MLWHVCKRRPRRLSASPNDSSLVGNCGSSLKTARRASHARSHLDRRHIRDPQSRNPCIVASSTVRTARRDWASQHLRLLSNLHELAQCHAPRTRPRLYKGWYNDIVDPNLDIRDGYLHAPQRPGVGTRLKAGVRERSDATIRVSNEPRKSLIDEWGTHPARTPESQARVDELEVERGPQV